MNSLASYRAKALLRPRGGRILEGLAGQHRSRSKPQDAALVNESRLGNKDAYRILVERYESRAFVIAYEIVRSREDAQDVVQEAFVKAFLSLEDFKGESSFYTWFYRIVYNMAIDLRRRILRRGGETREFDESRSGREEMFPLMNHSAEQGPQETFFRKEQAGRIQKVLDQLSEEHRTVIILREIEGMSYDEISSTVGISKGTVMSRLHYARKKLQLALKDMAPVASTKAENGKGGETASQAAIGDAEAVKVGVGKRYG